MPDWKRAMARTLVKSLRVAAREMERVTVTKRCPFWDCKDRIGANRRFCDRHRTESEQGLIDKCPGCGRAKYKQYGKCIDCSRKPRRRMAKATATNQTYSPEYSKAWEKGDATADRFFVYLLKLDGGEFYAGQTRELRARLSEHRDGGAKSTVGRNPKLVWFGMLQTREAATAAEVELKKLVEIGWKKRTPKSDKIERRRCQY